MSGALNHHRTVNKREEAPNGAEPNGSLTASISKKRKRSAPAADPRIQPFLSFFAEEYEKRFGAPYAINWGKEGKRITELSSAFDVPRLKDLAIRFFELEDPWIREKGGFTVGVFTSQINKLTSTANSNGNANPVQVKDLGDGWVMVGGQKMTRETYERRARDDERASE
jgi:hypothetical protein